ncbi:hypothetical protein MVLG_04795 [Microbotryum lychnidis-dioicae p1A1 Lamole]|uniref:Uncharacterized protein n=1 Tax=Microbotryum lychnidis-dioicae (strain p1A1 Lamole / MvSl-1064) TaxID=683840 RepID=U5HCA9_USTV1|nr:hypothetical protein MVLG_04795 [Microbotryum lychnidis-dioicae p1A1 Lamole]|eukprot:KDE04832.1 hypothetical protein MVLG_04795 [Microbotryum lychnidis-dioicae p1A1 Lamole]
MDPDWAGPDRIGTRYRTDEALRQVVQDGANDSIIIGIDLGTKCPMAVSATFFDRKEVQIQDDVVVYADALDKPLRKAQSLVRKLSAELAGSLRFGHAKPPGHATTSLLRDNALPPRPPRSTVLLQPPPTRVRPRATTPTHALAPSSLKTLRRAGDGVPGLRTMESSRDDKLKQADLRKVKTAEVLQRKDILSPRQRPVLVFLGEGGSSRGTQKATYRTNVLCRDLVQEFNRLQERGFVVEIVSVDEYKISSVCSDPPAATR